MVKGKPIKLTQEELDEAARVTAVDIAEARQFAQQMARRLGRNLLDAPKREVGRG